MASPWQSQWISLGQALRPFVFSVCLEGRNDMSKIAGLCFAGIYVGMYKIPIPPSYMRPRLDFIPIVHLSHQSRSKHTNMNDTFLFPFGFPSSLEEAWTSRSVMSQPIPYFIGIVLVMWTTYTWATSSSSLKRLPHVNPPSLISSAQAKREYHESANAILQKARKQYPNQAYRMTTDFGQVVMLQSELFHEIRNDPNLSFFGTFTQERIWEIPGFQPLAAIGQGGKLVQIIARKQLTQMLSQITAPLSEEIALSLVTILGAPTDWREIEISPAIRDVTTRMTSRVLLGEELARDEEWLRIMKNYSVDITAGIIVLSRYPVNLRPYIGWLFPECRRVRDYYSRAQALIAPVWKKREDLKRVALATGQPAPVFNDALEWITQESKGLNCASDVVTFQLVMSLVAISTTTDLIQGVLVDLIQHPDSMQAVRDEIVQILKQSGWKKTSLYNMKLLDSVIKETQRIRPIFTAMRRFVGADMVLPDGTTVKKGSRIHIDTHRMVDPKVYENPEEWKGSRFLELRSQPGNENSAQLASTSIDHFGFGHGEHACPGRFFAANEVKITLCHLLLKYDWELAPGTDTTAWRNGFSQRVNPSTTVLYRKRQSLELDIDSI
ncbi:cytochrome P450 monooxygenase [Xylaria palmicola]|nr:cytochrome P450 monooxygenase [Xylaria palmicola]